MTRLAATLAIIASSLASPVRASATDCGRLDAMPKGFDATTWTNYECASRDEVPDGWGHCLNRSDYTRKSGAGCPGSERCCPSDIVSRNFHVPTTNTAGVRQSAAVRDAVDSARLDGAPADTTGLWIIGVLLGGWLLFGFIGMAIANTKGRPILGFVMTMAFSLLGLIVVMLMPSKRVDVDP